MHEETFFKNVFKLKPGHYFIWRDNELEIKQYFEVKYPKKDKSKEQITKELSEILEQSVKYHQTTSDVEVGSYLSGGVDS